MLGIADNDQVILEDHQVFVRDTLTEPLLNKAKHDSPAPIVVPKPSE